MEHTKEELTETEIIREIEAILNFNDPNSIKASIILNRLRHLFGMKNIAATPDMYKALKETRDFLHNPTITEGEKCLRNIINKALSKAEGN